MSMPRLDMAASKHSEALQSLAPMRPWTRLKGFRVVA
jgi:hypothetical protein